MPGEVANGPGKPDSRSAGHPPTRGSDGLDGAGPGQGRPPPPPALARRIRTALRDEGSSLIIGAVGGIDDAAFARDVVQEGPEQSADLALAAKQFLRDPQFVLHAAHELGVPVKWPNQYHRAEPKEVQAAFKL